MKRECAVLGVLALVLVAGSWLFADDPKKDAPGKARGTLPAGWNKLGLTDQQKQKIYSTRAEYRAKIDALESQIKDLKKKEMTEMQAVLTDAQKARLREIATEKVPGATPPKEEKKPESKP